jgi:regulator of nucleoside diphosphate kinase
MNTSARPNITITSLDAERLERLIEALPVTALPGRALEEELARANVVAPEEVPPNVVTMNSTVKFRVDAANEEFTLTLVYPEDVDGSNGKISVLAPVGSALLGLATGDAIEWPRPGGGVLGVRIVDVTYQPERSGDYTR